MENENIISEKKSGLWRKQANIFWAPQYCWQVKRAALGKSFVPVRT
jgi:hypothetical protein